MGLWGWIASTPAGTWLAGVAALAGVVSVLLFLIQDRRLKAQRKSDEERRERERAEDLQSSAEQRSMIEEQLEFARQQAASSPRVEFLNAYLKRIQDEPDLYDEIADTARYSKKRRQEIEADKRARIYHEKHRLGPYISPLLRGGMIYGHYEGSYPTHCLCIRVGNSGGAAAHHVTGWVEIDKGVLEPVEEFLGEDAVIISDHRFLTATLKLTVPNEGSTLLVAAEAEHIFRIPIVVHQIVDLSIPWELSNSEEVSKSGTFRLPEVSLDI